MASNIELFYQQEIKRSKFSGRYITWGKKAIRALDNDNLEELLSVYSKLQSHGADINHQTNIYGYGGYIWTVWLHHHLGDTILHIAIKMKRLISLYFLLLQRDIDATVRNRQEQNCEELCQQVFQRSLQSFRIEAYEKLLPVIHPLKHHLLLPDNPKYRHIQEEAAYLIHEGRCLYSELPKFILNEKVIVKEQPTIPRIPVFPKPQWRRRLNESVNYAYLVNIVTNERRKMTSADMKLGHWEKLVNEFGQTRYFNEVKK